MSVRLSLPPRSRRFKVTLGVVWAAVTAACHKADDRADSTPPESRFLRGDIVVVERTAAEFFEGRVLAVAGATLKVQTTDEGDPVVVAQSDAYRVTASAEKVDSGTLGICSDRPTHWSACRVEAVDAAGVRVVLDSGAALVLAPSRVLKASAVTALNIRKAFDRSDAIQRFERAASNAGEPRRPVGWSPEAHEPVIARRGSQWFNAHVASMLGDGGVRILFEGADRAETVAPSSVVPIPPYPVTVTRGDFALVRPESATEPWSRVRVEGVGPEEAIVVGSDGARRRYETRQLVPVTAGP